MNNEEDLKKHFMDYPNYDPKEAMKKYLAFEEIIIGNYLYMTVPQLPTPTGGKIIKVFRKTEIQKNGDCAEQLVAEFKLEIHQCQWLSNKLRYD